MKTLWNIFKPVNKQETLSLILIAVCIGGFLIYEGVAFMDIINDPMQLDVWHSAEKIPTTIYLSLVETPLYDSLTELGSNHVFQMSLNHYGNTIIEISFDFIDCVPHTFVVVSGVIADIYYQLDAFIPVTSSAVFVVDGVLRLDMSDSLYSSDLNMLFIRVIDMSSNTVELKYKVNIL